MFVSVFVDLDGGECTDTTENIKFSVHETSRFRCIYWWVSFYSMFLIIPKHSSEYLPKYIFHGVLSTSEYILSMYLVLESCKCTLRPSLSVSLYNKY